MATTPKSAIASNTVQDTFLSNVVKNRTQVTIFLVNGVRLEGRISAFDSFTLSLGRGGQEQLVYKTAVSTVMPNAYGE